MDSGSSFVACSDWLVLAMVLLATSTYWHLAKEVAVGLGSNIRFTRLVSGLTIVLLAGASVVSQRPIKLYWIVSASFGSTYGWSQLPFAIPISALAGAALVSWSDALSRAIAFPTETPVGVITALLGTPCFILIATRRILMHHHTKIVLLSGILILVASAGLFVGAASLSIPQVIEHLVAFSSDDFVIHQYRLPRMLLAISVGAGLGAFWGISAGVIRNPLAWPYEY